MVIDSSALLAILLDEPERVAFRHAMDQADVRLANDASLLETSMVVLTRLGEAGILEYERLLAAIDVTPVPFDGKQGEIAFEAFRRFGKGRHRAGLNFGDCFSYALAKSTGRPLLFKGRFRSHGHRIRRLNDTSGTARAEKPIPLLKSAWPLARPSRNHMPGEPAR